MNNGPRGSAARSPASLPESPKGEVLMPAGEARAFAGYARTDTKSNVFLEHVFLEQGTLLSGDSR